MNSTAGPGGAGAALYDLGLPFGYGRMLQTPLLVPTPAVATGASYVVKGGYRDRIVCASATLVTDANVANRSVSLALEDADANVLLQLPPAAVQAAGITVRYSWAVHVSGGVAAVAGAQVIQIPPLILYPGWQWVWTIGSVQAGDQLSAIAGLREQFPTGAMGYPVGVVAADDQLIT